MRRWAIALLLAASWLGTGCGNWVEGCLDGQHIDLTNSYFNEVEVAYDDGDAWISLLLGQHELDATDGDPCWRDAGYFAAMDRDDLDPSEPRDRAGGQDLLDHYYPEPLGWEFWITAKIPSARGEEEGAQFPIVTEPLGPGERGAAGLAMRWDERSPGNLFSAPWGIDLDEYGPSYTATSGTLSFDSLSHFDQVQGQLDAVFADADGVESELTVHFNARLCFYSYVDPDR